MKRNTLSLSSSGHFPLVLQCQLSPSQEITTRKKSSSCLFLSLLVLLGIVLLSSVPLASCQGSLIVRREISSKRMPYQFSQSNWDTDDAVSLSSHSIRKRDTSQSSSSSLVTLRPTTEGSGTTASGNGGRGMKSNNETSKVLTNAVHLNDSHNQLLVFWAGEDVILCLAKDANSNGSSTLFISKDYGANFTNATLLLLAQNQSGGSAAGTDGSTPSALPPPVLEGFFNHPSFNGHFAFTDVTNKVIYTTRNYGSSFTASKVDFVPDAVLFDPHSDSNIVAFEKTTKNKMMFISIDLGKTWTKVQEHVKSLSWDESSMPAVLYLQREVPSDSASPSSSTAGEARTVILKSDSLFLDPKDTEVIVSGVEEFEIKDDFMFATKPVENSTYELLISYRKSPFRKAIFPSHQTTKHFFIADVSSDGQIFVCVVQNESVSNLYIGSFPQDEENPKFTLSLERILYFKPNVTWSESWLNEVTSEPFVDLHSVEGLRGVYIASQLKSSTVSNGKFNLNEVISLITYDQGAEWSVIKPPEFEHDGRPIYCQYSGGGNCSLHISQRLNELYPRTRAVPILSKKSGVGIILATGTVNTTLKGHLGVYLSTDGANSWRQILQGNYLYAMGDHGGIIVATKMYRIGDDTNELLYSVDEGETWARHQFYEEKVRIMGLMTEPGENTTTFFIFGSVVSPSTNASNASGNARHTWVLIKVDFRRAFDRDCGPDDYKMWSPLDGEDGSPRRDCLLGRKEMYERRIPTHKCYNGKSFVRKVTNATCPCKRVDFECDFGYVIDPHGDGLKRNRTCIKDNSETSPGVKAEWCQPLEQGLPTYYNKTKGYRKIPGDTCTEGSWVDGFLPEKIPCEVKAEPEFLLVAKRDAVLRIDLNHFERVEILPLARVQAAIAVDFNLKNNCIFWSDVHHDHKAIMKLHLDGKSSPETLINTDVISVEGLAYDWMSNNLYFSDGAGAKIEVVRVDNKRMRRRILSKPHVEKPRGIAVHPEKGYIFWTDWSTTQPGIGRAHLDGSNNVKIVGNKVNPNGHPVPISEQNIKWPNGITIDYQRNRLFWVDASLDRMLTSDLDGKNLMVVLEKNVKISHPFAVAVYKNNIYWDDWTTRGIYGAQEGKGDSISITNDAIYRIKGDLPRLMDLKVYGVGMQGGENACSSPTHSNCSHLCFAQPVNGTETPMPVCKCPDGFNLDKESGACLCPDGKAPSHANGTGTATCESRCTPTINNFHCRAHPDFCIIEAWRCDGENDCADGSDEEDCDKQMCADPQEFKCQHSGRCIPHSFRCDFDHDCGPTDTSDEDNCTSKTNCEGDKSFQCANGRCILKSWQCDDDDDCLDGSDEKNCTVETVKNGTFSCPDSEIKCPNESKCLSPDWICDFDHDCQDGSDEVNCTGRVCPDWKFTCNRSGGCIMKTWVCDGDKDCPDGSDEHENCPPTTTGLPIPDNPFGHGNCSQMSQMFECLGSKECIPIYWKCDHVKDCQDGSDELGCPGGTTDGPHMVTLSPPLVRCEVDQWHCNGTNKTCIAMSSVCDHFPDCPQMDDEVNCYNTSFGGCPVGTRKCGESLACVPHDKWCNGHIDCPMGADEVDCGKPSTVNCSAGQFECDDGCVPLFRKCDGSPDCYDLSDEKEDVCTSSYQKVAQVEGMSYLEIDSTWILMEWWLPRLSGKKLEFLPSVCEFESGHCTNYTATTNRSYVLDKLHPFKKYSTTVFVRDTGSNTTFPPFVYQNVTTAEDVAGAPWGVHVAQNTSEDLIISWKRPTIANGRLSRYHVYFQPPTLPPAEIEADHEMLIISNKQSDPVFLPGENYTFWVAAVNGKGEGNLSEVVSYVYNGEVAWIQQSDLKLKSVAENSVKISWEPSNNHVDSYLITITKDTPGSMYPFQNRSETKKKLFEFQHLSSGTAYKFTIQPKYKGMHGPLRSLSFTTKGSPLPVVESFKGLIAQNGHAKLTWRAVKVPGEYLYAIYYGKTAQEITDRRANFLTDQTQYEVTTLDACENYLFDVGLYNKNTGEYGPLTEKALQLVTKMNPTSPPKGVEVKRALDTDGSSQINILVTWKSPCDVMDKAIGYNITVLETTKNKVYGVSNVEVSIKPQLSYILNFRYGGHYQLTVSTNVDGGKPSAPVYFDGPAIPFPDEIRQCSQCYPLTIFWSPPHLPHAITHKGEHTYKVWLSKSRDFTDATHYETSESSFKFDTITDNGIYYAAVSVLDAEGLESPMSTPIIIQHQDGAAPLVVLPSSKALFITITVLGIIVVLVVLLGVFVVRHKRLQTSFLNFASSHYSSSSGAATFQQTMEDQDSPVIRGFSDDEPLLVA